MSLVLAFTIVIVPMSISAAPVNQLNMTSSDINNFKELINYALEFNNPDLTQEMIDYYVENQSSFDSISELREDMFETGHKIKDYLYTYDSSGNIKTISLNGALQQTFTYDLSGAGSDTNDMYYTYNYQGIRTNKTVNGVTTQFTLDEMNNIVKQIGEINTLEFVYDSNNSPIYLTWNRTTYYYEKNLQGDIVGLLDESGNSVVQYEYDIWGAVLSVSGSLADTLGAANPLRYRGYYYDSETELYYLQSRYYSPELMRFISQDDPYYSNSQGQPLGSNLYAYCLNNPVMGSDPSGYQPKWATAISRYAKGTLAYRAFLHATQKGWFSSLYWSAGFFRDSNGIYHTRQDCWQQFFGYNNFYDWAFSLGTSMERINFPFFSGNKEYVFWAWKGDYLNLGAGAEFGIYSRLVFKGCGTGHWLAETQLAMPMMMTLKHNGKTIATYKPTQNQWWITSFNPYYQSVKSKTLNVIFTISFSSNKTLFNDFYKIYKNHSKWKFDTKKYKATFTF